MGDDGDTVWDEGGEEPDEEFCRDLLFSSLEVAYLFLSSGTVGVLYAAGVLDALLPEGQRSARLKTIALVDEGEDSRWICCGFFSLMVFFGLFISASVRVENTTMLKKSAILCGLLSIVHLFFTWNMVIFTEAGNVLLIAVSTATSLFLFYDCMVLWCYAEELKALKAARLMEQKTK